MRPGSATLQLSAFVAIFSAICMAGSGLTAKALTQHGEKGTKVVFIFGLLSTPVILIYAGLNLTWPGWYAVMLMLMVGGLGGLGQTCLANAYQRADASLVMALDFLRLPFVIVAAGFIIGVRFNGAYYRLLSVLYRAKGGEIEGSWLRLFVLRLNNL